MGLELQAAQHVGQVAAKLARVQRVTPEFAQRRARLGRSRRQALVLAQGGGHFGLAARHQHQVLRPVRQRKGDGVVGGGVAGVQGGDHIDHRRQLGLQRLLHRGGDKAHARKAQPLRQRLRAVHQFDARLDADHPALAARLEKTVVEQKTQIGFAATVIDQRHVAAPLQHVEQQRLDKVQQMLHLLELAPAVLVQAAVARQDVQVLQQLDRLPAQQRVGGVGRAHKPSDCASASMRWVTAGLMWMLRPHSRVVSPGHLWVASSPILLPRPLTGEAKSR